ncbi:protein mono-ADP-ribosyltransferase PARP4-like [Acridotheres tristis]
MLLPLSSSLVPNGKEKLLPLVATVLVLHGAHWAFVLMKKAIELVRRQFPSICYQVELGKDWDSATKKISSLSNMNYLSA